MNEAEHKKKLSEAGKRVQNSKTLRELCTNLNAYEVAHFKAREDYPGLATFQTGEFDLEKLPSFGGAVPPDNKDAFSWDGSQVLVLSSTGGIYTLEDR
ncbi:MAG: hypothetical protein ABSF90_22535 [Syntrophobacteraceae bacterium]